MVNNYTDDVAHSLCRTLGLTYVQPCASGAFKRTYLVQDAATPLALKIVANSPNPDRIRREVEAHLTCNHPHIARLIAADTVRHGGREFFYFIENFLVGGTLTDKLLLRTVLPRKEIFQLGVALADALCHLEERRIVHRDIKPDNIMFDGLGEPILVDFGIARHLAATSLTKTWVLHGPGTPAFAAPEQLNNEKTLIDWRTDQFALGVTLSMAAFGHHPFTVNGNLEEAVDQVVRWERPTEAFEAAACDTGLGILVKMVDPWPVRRVLRPQELLEEWRLLREEHHGGIPSGRLQQ